MFIVIAFCLDRLVPDGSDEYTLKLGHFFLMSSCLHNETLVSSSPMGRTNAINRQSGDCVTDMRSDSKGLGMILNVKIYILKYMDETS